MSHKPADRIRNVALIGHRGAGKTSICEAMLFEAGVVNRVGSVEEGTTVCDAAEDERARGMSIDAAAATFEHEGRKVNVIDTPGEPSFIAQAISALSVADAAVLVVNAVSGVEVGTDRLWHRAAEAGLPRLVFVNMLDRERADYFATLEGLKSAFGPHVVATEIPIGAEHEVRGVVDLIDMKAFLHDSDGRGAEVEAEIPEEVAVLAEEYREKLMDEVAENSDELMEHYLEGAELSHAEIVSALKRGVTEGNLFPVTCGVATRNLGTGRLLEALIEDLPSPAMRGPRELIGPGGEPVEVEPSEDAGLVAYVFKTTADQFAGRLNMVRILAGTLAADSTVENVTSDAHERIGQLYEIRGGKLEQVDDLGPGDIGVVPKLKDTHAGDLLCDSARELAAPKLEFPNPVMSFAFEPTSRGDEEKAVAALRRLREEDPTLDIHRDAQTGEEIIAGLTQIHVEVIVERMRSRYGVEIELHPPRVPYVEAIREPAAAHSRFKKQSGGRGQFADCKLEIEPGEPGSGLEFADRTKGGVVPGGFIPAVEAGVREAMEHGTLAGYPVRDVRVSLVDGQHHSVDSSEIAFKICASMGFKEAMAKAGPVLLEPIVRLTIAAPNESVGDVIGDLNSRRGHPLGMEPKGGGTEIVAEVPMADVLDYAPALRAITGGRGEYTVEFDHHQEVPAHLADKVIEAARNEGATAVA
jgi:elongation factor G